MLPLWFLSGFIATAVAWDGWSTNGSAKVMGLNIGSYFIPEVWMMQQFIACYAPGVNDTWGLQSLSADTVDEIMINHLDNYIREVNFADAKAYGVNMVRIPIAFWMFIPTEGNEPYWTDSRQKDVYLLQLVKWAQQYDMEVILDLHALPGGQNTDADSGRNLVIAGLEPEFYNSTNLFRGNATVEAVIEWVQSLPDTLTSTIAMIELINEPTVSVAGAYDGLVGYYLANQAKVEAALPNVWTMISDAWLGADHWGSLFGTSQNVVLDLHWWIEFDAPPSLNELETTYCSLTEGTGSDAWKNPIIVGEFAADQNNGSLIDSLNAVGKLQFYQEYYSTQLWAARGSGGALPLYQGGILWSMVCTNCGPVWQPYYIVGESGALDVTEPNWCKTSGSTSTLAINPSPTHPANSCGIYDNAASATSAGATSTGTSTATTTAKSAASPLQGSNLPLMVLLFVGTIFWTTLWHSIY